MKKDLYKYLPYIIIIILIVALYFIFRQSKDYKDKYKEQIELYESLTDTLRVYKNKDSLNVATIKVIETNRAEDFAKIKNLEGYNLKLQQLVVSQGKSIKDLTSALIIATETHFIDTVREYLPLGGDSIVFSKSVLLDSVNNKWINAIWGFRMGKSILQLKTFDEFSIVIKDSKEGSYAEITNMNPYSTTKDMRVYNVSVPKQKKIGIGYNIGVGAQYGYFNRKFDVGPYIGIGINGNLFEW